MRLVLTVLLLVQPSLAGAQQRGWPVAARATALPVALLAAHNLARARHGAAPLRWDEALAADARAYAGLLARTNSFQHDSTPGRRKRQGENLWMGPRGVYDYGAMATGFLGEERRFRPGVFPAVSTTGNWADVAHFTQIIWPTTTTVGCALASNSWSDFLVCRYAPPGNKDGMAVR